MSDYPRRVLLSDHRGIYIPQDFVNGFVGWKYIDDEDRAILEAGPDHEHYWDAWDNVLENARYFDTDGNEWMLEQDGDLFTVPADIDQWNADIFGEYFKNREEWNLEYVQSDDYVYDYAYLMSESNRINESVRRLFRKQYGVTLGARTYRIVMEHADDIASRIYNDNLFEHEVCDEYSSESYGYLDSFQIGEYEDQIDVKQLYEEIGDKIIADGFSEFCDALQSWIESQRDFCINDDHAWRIVSDAYDRHPTIYLITYIGLRVDYVVREETLSELITEHICDLCRK